MPRPLRNRHDGQPDFATAKRLLNIAKGNEFAFHRTAPTPDGLLRGVRKTLQWVDEIYLGGFWKLNSRHAIRRCRSSLIVPSGLPVTEQVHGDALTVLHTVLYH